ncbi:MAG: NnrU family protein [Rhizobiales bacterium]|nr:NnrU family protein [Hyphomicrobiales bacterium]
MTILVLGLIVFLGSHSVRIVAEDWRMATRARLGEGPWKGAYSLVSLLGFALIVWGFGLARANDAQLWTPPVWTRHLAATLMLASAVAIAAFMVRGSHVAAALRHPMLWGVALWSAAHLMANGGAADVVLFGAFLVWSLADLVSALRRGGAVAPASAARTLIVFLLGAAIWAALVFGLHLWLFGVAPLPPG